MKAAVGWHTLWDQQVAKNAARNELDLWLLAGVRQGAAVADVGCGSGAATELLLELVGAMGRVVALDRDRAMCAVARDLAGPRAQVLCAEADAVPLRHHSFDVVLVRNVLAHNGGNEARILRQLAELIVPGGRMVLVDIDATESGVVVDCAPAAELHQRYRDLHALKGHDLRIGRSLEAIALSIGLRTEASHAWESLIPLRPGAYGPGWRSRYELLDVGLASTDDIRRWQVAFEELDDLAVRPNIRVSNHGVVARYLPSSVETTQRDGSGYCTTASLTGLSYATGG